MKNENRWKGLIQTFEFTIELACKTMKDKLEFGGIVAKLPRDVIKEALQTGYISDGITWIDAIDKRNEMSHMYDEIMTQKTEQLIRNSYAPILEELYQYFKKSILVLSEKSTLTFAL